MNIVQSSAGSKSRWLWQKSSSSKLAVIWKIQHITTTLTTSVCRFLLPPHLHDLFILMILQQHKLIKASCDMNNSNTSQQLWQVAQLRFLLIIFFSFSTSSAFLILLKLSWLRAHQSWLWFEQINNSQPLCEFYISQDHSSPFSWYQPIQTTEHWHQNIVSITNNFFFDFFFWKFMHTQVKLPL